MQHSTVEAGSTRPDHPSFTVVKNHPKSACMNCRLLSRNCEWLFTRSVVADKKSKPVSYYVKGCGGSREHGREK